MGKHLFGTVKIWVLVRVDPRILFAEFRIVLSIYNSAFFFNTLKDECGELDDLMGDAKSYPDPSYNRNKGLILHLPEDRRQSSAPRTFGNYLSWRQLPPWRLHSLPGIAYSQWLTDSQEWKVLALLLQLKTDLKFILSLECPTVLAKVSHWDWTMGWLSPLPNPKPIAFSCLPQLLIPGDFLINLVHANLHLRVCSLGNTTCNRLPSGSLPFITFHNPMPLSLVLM